MILGIDPGNNTGWAILDHGGKLQSCGVGMPPNPLSDYFFLVVIECPQVYPGMSSKIANDLVKLAVNAGEYKYRYRSVLKTIMVIPHEWKGNTPKDVHNRRVLRLLDTAEAARIPVMSKTKKHNMVDAIGLAKWGFRFQKELGSRIKESRVASRF